jgi:ubiquinone/menaquinone biosynthesis C-methylase UbiE
MKFSKFFSNLQEAPWYREFLNPVINQIDTSANLLDIETGSGKMLEILFTEKNVVCIGTDTNKYMLKEAAEKLKNTGVKLKLTPKGKPLNFEKNSFDYITICSVFFHLEEKEINTMLHEYLQLLKKNGKIIILTPTGSGNLFKLSKQYFSLKNLSIYIWYRATKNSAQLWIKNKYLLKYSAKNQLKYKSEIVMNGFAQLEIINN